jgi:hypothetical protein
MMLSSGISVLITTVTDLVTVTIATAVELKPAVMTVWTTTATELLIVMTQIVMPTRHAHLQVASQMLIAMMV